MSARQKVGLFTGLLFLTGALVIPAPEGLDTAAWRTAGLGLMMALWWITEAIPLAATALIPIVLLPVLGIRSIGDATAPYAHPIIFLFLGGFLIAIAIQAWNLHRRIALNIIRRVGVRPRRIVLGFMLGAAFLSMWVSNTSTALMILPIAISVIELLGSGKSNQYGNFEVTLLLGIAYACNVGGMATIIGTPPNALAVAYIEETYGVEIGFASWMIVGLPTAALAVPLIYVCLTRVLFPVREREIPQAEALLAGELESLGPLSRQEKRVAAVFVVTVTLWMIRPLLAGLIPGISDAGIAVAGALSMFLIPSGRGGTLLQWENARDLPWGILLLFGGGLSLAAAIGGSGLADEIGRSVGALETWPVVLIVAATVATIVLLTEMTSNAATAAAFLPVLGPVALATGQEPILLIIPAALAASCAFMLPVATPPNAIVYGTGRLKMTHMTRAGIVLNVLFTGLITVLALTLVSAAY